MKKLLLILFIIPAFIYGQDTPLIEQKVTTEKMEKEDQKKKDKKDKNEFVTNSFTPSLEGKKDAKVHYHYKNCGRNLTGIISVFSPLTALIPATAYSLSAPKVKNLNYPSSEKMRNIDYNLGYQKQAHKMKSRQVWLMLGLGTLINLGIWTIIDNNN